MQKMEDFHRLKMRPELIAVAEKLADEPVFVIPATIGRLGFPRDNERITQPHQDWLYLQGSTETISCWIPVGDVPEAVGGLKILAGSHKAGVLRARSAKGPGGNTVDIDPTLQWVASPYQAGDALFFHQLTVHGARENFTQDRLRVSIDVRYVGISHTIREDWLRPHFSWLGEKFTWEHLDRDWNDQSLRRYWERGPKIKTCTDEAHPRRW
jgi:ectoine hydroxylase-related dioxygenase (phytanoyl-CoA dioxygenase family)